MLNAKPNQSIFIITTFLMGICSSIFSPLQNYYFVKELGAAPSLVGIYLAVSSVATILISQFFAIYSDRGVSRHRLIIFSAMCGIVAFIGFVFIDNIYGLALIGLTLLACVSIGAPQLFALAAEVFADENETLMATMRAVVSMAWIIGPPLAFGLVSLFDFNITFFILIVFYAFIVVSTLKLGKPLVMNKHKAEPVLHCENSSMNFQMFMAIAGMVFLFAAGTNYTMAMPLYILHAERLPDWLPGVLFGLTAACEIPFMLFAGRMSKKITHQHQLIIAAILGLIYYLCFTNVSTIALLLALQLIGAASIALSATAGLQFFQNQARNRLGYASTLYANSIIGGMALGSFVGGLIADGWGYHIALINNVILCALSVLCFYLAGRVKYSYLPIKAWYWFYYGMVKIRMSIVKK